MASNQQLLSYHIRYPVTREMIAHLAQQTGSVIRHLDPQAGMPNRGSPSPPSTPTRTEASALPTSLPPLEKFITTLCERSNVQTPTLMSTAVYLHRFKDYLPRVSEVMQCTGHRVFLAALILSAKYLNDSSPKNKQWARYAMGLFSLSEVNLMEKQFLFLLDWDLHITPEDLYTHVLPYFLQCQARLRPTQFRRSPARPLNPRSTRYPRLPQRAYPPPLSTIPSSSSSSICSSPLSTDISSPLARERKISYTLYEPVPRAMVKSPRIPTISQPVIPSQRGLNPAKMFSRLQRKRLQSSPMYSRPIQDAW